MRVVNVKPAGRLADPEVAEALAWPGRLVPDAWLGLRDLERDRPGAPGQPAVPGRLPAAVAAAARTWLDSVLAAVRPGDTIGGAAAGLVWCSPAGRASGRRCCGCCGSSALPLTLTAALTVTACWRPRMERDRRAARRGRAPAVLTTGRRGRWRSWPPRQRAARGLGRACGGSASATCWPSPAPASGRRLRGAGPCRAGPRAGQPGDSGAGGYGDWPRAGGAPATATAARCWPCPVSRGRSTRPGRQAAAVPGQGRRAGRSVVTVRRVSGRFEATARPGWSTSGSAQDGPAGRGRRALAGDGPHGAGRAHRRQHPDPGSDPGRDRGPARC